MPMNRVVALGIVCWIAFAVLGGCQGADPFDRAGGGGGGGSIGSGGKIVSGNGGKIVTGNGGSIVTGNGGSGAGGSSIGGRGAGGNSSMGGRAMGGNNAAGGAAGIGAGGSNLGGRGMGGTGAGGRIDAGANCVSAIQGANYSATGAPPCSACMENGNSKAADCMMMIDCMVGCYPMNNCELNCLHAVSGSGPLQGCVDALLTAGGCQ